MCFCDNNIFTFIFPLSLSLTLPTQTNVVRACPPMFRHTSRYEIEYDENRLEIGRDIGKRFLGIPYADGVGDHNNTSSATTNNSLTGGDSSCAGDDQLDSGIDTIKTSDKSYFSKEYRLGGGGLVCDDTTDELVLDVLNDDLISKVQEKITRKCIGLVYFTK